MPITFYSTGAQGNLGPAEAVEMSMEPQPTLTASPTFVLTGNGGPTGKYQAHVQTQAFNGGTVSLASGGTTYATWGPAGATGDSIMALPQGTYQFTFSGTTLPSQVVASVRAV